MITMYTSNLVCIAAVGHLGELELAAASMSISMYSILGQGIILSMVGALDTQASQVVATLRHGPCLSFPAAYFEQHVVRLQLPAIMQISGMIDKL